MNIGNPINAIPRYAKIVAAGVQKKPFNTFDPTMAAAPIDRADTALYQGANWVADNKLAAGAGAIGAIAANQMLGNPVGGAVDALSFGLTNFRPDSEVGSDPTPGMTIIMQQPGMQQKTTPDVAPTQPMSIPALNEEDRKRQQQYLQRKVATDLLTIQALQQQPGMRGGEYGDL